MEFILTSKTTFRERGQRRSTGLIDKLSHAIWHCMYHIVWTPKYRYRILKGEIKIEVERCLKSFSEQKGCVIE